MIFFERKYLLFFIFLFAFMMRLVFAIKSNSIPSHDALIYDRLALSITQGSGYVDSDGKPHSAYPPFYPFFLAVIYKIFGHNYTVVRIIQSLIGAFSCLLIYLIGKKIHSIVLGLMASFISIIYFPFIKSAELLLTEQVFTFLLLSIVFYSVKIQKENFEFKNCIIVGLLLGMSVLTKSIMLLFPIFIIPVFFYAKEKYILPIFKKYMLTLLFFCISLAPWIIRNYNVYHEFIPISAAGGYVFYSSYFPAGGIFGHNASEDDPVIVEGKKIESPSKSNQFFIRKTFNFIINNPKKFLILELKKILYFWAPFDWEIVGGRWFNFMYVVALPFFIIGLFTAVKKFKKNYPILVPLVYFQMMTLIFYGSPRFRLPIEPYIFILAAMGTLRCWKVMFNKKVHFNYVNCQ